MLGRTPKGHGLYIEEKKIIFFLIKKEGGIYGYIKIF